MRNEFMHSIVKKGKYKIKNRTTKDISGAYSVWQDSMAGLISLWF